MKTAEGAPPLDPFPDGWYLIEPAEQLREGQLMQKTWMGREIVAWRDRGGAVCVADAFCPHLGAHLGPEHGGVVRDGKLVCPFHGFAYDTTGRCVATPHAPPPKSARLRSYAVQEVNGFVFAYWDRHGREPIWRIPDASPDGWAGRSIVRRRLRSHPQATTENSVDFGHLSYVHGYGALKQLAPTVIDGPFLRAFYTFRRRMLTRGLRRFRISVNIEISVCGLGVSLVEIHSPATDLRVLQWVIATPVDGEWIDLWLAVDPKGRPRVPGLGMLPSWISRRFIPRILRHELELDVMKDARIWATQRYQPMPALSKDDHDIYRFRRYCEQFYAAAEAASTETGLTSRA